MIDSSRANPTEHPTTEFWLVWRADGAAPTFAHANAYSAKREAERLAASNPGHHFFVLRSEGSFVIERPQPKWLATTETEPPF